MEAATICGMIQKAVGFAFIRASKSYWMFQSMVALALSLHGSLLEPGPYAIGSAVRAGSG